ncbi:TonB family protein [Rubrivirga sp. IMCC45206]|uniref:TonB family protein n=1 Tax=Rubrivirga sp. IMCC45206 TaxID=3391614 RepID=UPI00398FD55D
MRTLFFFAVLLLAVDARAQALRVVAPTLSVDGDRVATIGGPIVQTPFGVLTIAVPGDGTYLVSDRPFAGARRGGQFDGRGLYLAANGRSVRLVSREPILDARGPVTAYVRHDRRRVAPGPARLAVADGVDGRGLRSAERSPSVRTPAAGPRSGVARPAAPRGAQLDPEAARLRVELDRLVADRQRMARERDRLRAERDAALRDRQRAEARSQSGPSERLAALVSDRDRLGAEVGRLQAERRQLAAALDRANVERDRLATAFASLRERAETADARTASSRRAAEDAARLRAEVDRLRRDLVAADGARAALSAEQADRTGRLGPVQAQLAQAQRDLAQTVADRDRAITARDRANADRDAAYAQRDDALLARDASAAAVDALREQLAQAGGPAAPPSGDLDALRAALARDRALLAADRAALEAERRALESAGSLGSAATADRAALLDRLAAANAEREALADERDRLAAELADLRANRSPAPTAQTPAAPATGTGVAFLPGFDFGRLANPDVIRRRLDEAEYPRWATIGRIEGDVLVLFQTDPTGRVIRTAVPTPIGGGLDGLAEEVVREMRFVPPVVDGQPTGLRSQVVVRFEI